MFASKVENAIEIGQVFRHRAQSRERESKVFEKLKIENENQK